MITAENNTGKSESTSKNLFRFLKGGPKDHLVKVAVYQNVHANAAAVDELLKESKKLYAAGKKKQAQNLLNIAKNIVNNNKELQETVGEVLNDS